MRQSVCGSAAHSAPSGPAVSAIGDARPGSVYSVITPAVVIFPTFPAPCSVNQRLPSGPATMIRGTLPGDGSGYTVTTPSIVTRPTPTAPTNHMFPSGPATIETAPPKGCPIGYSV